jgi:tetraacyldisaccharide 4'-kinase
LRYASQSFVSDVSSSITIFTSNMQYLRWLLLPFSLIYGLVVIIRNLFYDWGVFKSYQAEVPVISVGNLDIGGAGKSPMTEYLIRLFKNNHRLATLSRGYGRQTRGFYSTATATATATDFGDEPTQFAQKFPDVTVAVCEDRIAGIYQLQATHNLIILDDAYQHRAVKPGFSILLFDHSRVKAPQLLLPAGNLREPLSGRKRADVIVISKCPENLSDVERALIVARVKPYPHQQVFFTAINYFALQKLNKGEGSTAISAGTTVFLITGIANPKPLVQHIRASTQNIIHYNYPDHHRFSLKNISKLADEFNNCPSKNKLIITTEKDAQRLTEHGLLPAITKLPVWVLPIGIKFLADGQQVFDNLVINYDRKYPEHRPVY